MVNLLSNITDIQGIEIGGTSIFQKATPIYDSTVLGVKIKYIIVGLIAYNIIKEK